MIEIVMSNDFGAVRGLAAQGWCPVECAFGDESVTDELLMDHHGAFSHLESVAVRALRDHAGAREADPRFVLTGVADADAAFAIAALAGLIPAGSPQTQALARTIALMDTDPVGRDMTALPGGRVLACWNALYGGGRDRLAAFAAVDGWRKLTGPMADRLAPFTDAACAAIAARQAIAAQDMVRYGHRRGALLVISGASAPGFDVWYGRNAAAGSNHAPAGWDAPAVLARAPNGAVTLGCPNTAVAEALFGAGGLRNVYPQLAPPGWGGREAIGGGPRGLALDDAAFDTAVATLVELLESAAYSTVGQLAQPFSLEGETA